MELEAGFLERARNYETLSRWERSELGRDLRRAGLSYGEIMGLIDVKKSTLATWCRDVELTAEQIAAIATRTGSIRGLPRDTNRKRRLEIEGIRQDARAQVPGLACDPYWVAGVVLYWAEGTKTRNKFSVANTDPAVLRLFVGWVRCYLMPDPEFRLSLHLHEGNDDAASQEYWRDALSLPSAEFTKTFIKPRGTGHRKNTHVHGVCTVRVLKSSNSWQTAMAWIEELPGHLSVGRGNI